MKKIMMNKMMKKHFNCILTKFLFFAPAMGVVLPFVSPANLSEAILIAVVATLATYLTADLVILPRYGNVAAIAADAVIAVAVALEFTLILYNVPLKPLGMLLIAVVTAAGEWYYHGYLLRVLFGRGRHS
jgi:hypothetical protein